MVYFLSGAPRPSHPDVAEDVSLLAQLLLAINRWAEAESLMRRALASDELSFGPNDHTKVARDLNNLAMLLAKTNRYAQAEPLMRRMLEIFVQVTRTTRRPHPQLQTAVNNYVRLLQTIGHGSESIMATLRKIAPDFF